jgi:hypothetical protein
MIGSGVVGIIITLLVVCLVYFILKWIIDSAPFISDRAKQIIGWVLIVLCSLWVIDVLLGIAGVNVGGNLGSRHR